MAVPAASQAALTTLSYSPEPSTLREMNGSSAYTWRLDNLPSAPITSASITFTGVSNAQGGSNRLFGHLLDSAKGSGVSSFVDNPNSRRAVVDLTDDFANPRHHVASDWLVAPEADGTKLFGKSFGMTPESWTYTFTDTEVSKLNQYLSDGSIAFGFDSDGHYFNEGITFNVRFGAVIPPAASPIPEASAVLPLSLVLVMAVAHQSRSRRRAESLAA